MHFSFLFHHKNTNKLHSLSFFVFVYVVIFYVIQSHNMSFQFISNAYLNGSILYDYLMMLKQCIWTEKKLVHVWFKDVFKYKITKKKKMLFCWFVLNDQEWSHIGFPFKFTIALNRWKQNNNPVLSINVSDRLVNEIIFVLSMLCSVFSILNFH